MKHTIFSAQSFSNEENALTLHQPDGGARGMIFDAEDFLCARTGYAGVSGKSIKTVVHRINH